MADSTNEIKQSIDPQAQASPSMEDAASAASSAPPAPAPANNKADKPRKKEKFAPAERVPIFVPRSDTRGDENLLIAINGVNYLLPRGKKSMVPPAVAKEYHRYMRACDRAAEAKDGLINTK